MLKCAEVGQPRRTPKHDMEWKGNVEDDQSNVSDVVQMTMVRSAW